jgi:hypothetical protein
MRKIDKLNPLARRMADALLRDFPKFRRRLEVLAGGDFRTHVVAPKGSSAHGLRVCTANAQDTWVQIGVPNAFYSVDTEQELLEVVAGLLSDELQFAVKDKVGRWCETTLVRDAEDLPLRKGERGRTYSWSGKRDSQLPPK